MSKIVYDVVIIYGLRFETDSDSVTLSWQIVATRVLGVGVLSLGAKVQLQQPYPKHCC